MSLAALRDRLPAYARDIAANLEAVEDETQLSATQKWGAMLGCAYACGVDDLTRAVEAEADLANAERQAVKSAAALMAMNTVYYRATHLMKNPEYATLPARLKAEGMTEPGVAAIDFELWCVAISALAGCAVCLDAHEGELRRNAVPAVKVQAALRIAAVIAAVARVLGMEAAAREP